MIDFCIINYLNDNVSYELMDTKAFSSSSMYERGREGYGDEKEMDILLGSKQSNFFVG